MSFDATPGGAESNSYISAEDAKAYFKTRIHSELWAAFPDQKAALQTATRVLDRYVTWVGNKSFEIQALDWPRTGVVDDDGYAVSDIEVPDDIKEATCEMAYAMLEEDLTAANDMEGIKSLKVGSLAIEADKKDRGETIPEAVWAAIGSLGKRPMSRCGDVRVVRW